MSLIFFLIAILSIKIFCISLTMSLCLHPQIPCRVSELDPAFTFVLDIGHTLYLWHGNLTPTEEDLQCTRYVQALKAARGAATRVEALDDDTEIDSVRH